MRIEIIAKNSRPSEKLAEITKKKISKLDKYFEDDTTCRVYLKSEGNKCKMEVQLDYKGNFLRAQAYADNYYDALDIVLPKIERQIYKHRSKLEKKLKSTAFKESMIYATEPEKEHILVKSKSFEMRPMKIDEAIEEFEMIGHSFYVFLDAESNSIKVLYVRDDGNYGIIEPVVNA